MRAESTIKPRFPFEVIEFDETELIIFYTNVQKQEVMEESEVIIEKYVYDEYRLEVPKRPNLEANVQENYEAWLELAIEKENEPRPETASEKLARIEKENKQLGIELSEREINEIIQGLQISDLEIQLLELQIGGN